MCTSLPRTPAKRTKERNNNNSAIVYQCGHSSWTISRPVITKRSVYSVYSYDFVTAANDMFLRVCNMFQKMFNRIIFLFSTLPFKMCYVKHILRTSYFCQRRRFSFDQTSWSQLLVSKRPHMIHVQTVRSTKGQWWFILSSRTRIQLQQLCVLRKRATVGFHNTHRGARSWCIVYNNRTDDNTRWTILFWPLYFGLKQSCSLGRIREQFANGVRTLWYSRAIHKQN